MRLFLAGATGVVGRRLIPRLLSAGHEITGTARSDEKAENVRALGAHAVVVDVFDAKRLSAVVADAAPEVVLHQLTALPDTMDPEHRAEMTERNARIRTEGTANLVAASLQAGARRIVAQSIAWAYASGPLPHREAAPLDLKSEGTRLVTVRAVEALERAVLNSPPIEGVVLRFGYFYGPDTWYSAPTGEVSVHVDRAVDATFLAITKGAPGIYNIVDEGGTASNEKARAELGWGGAERDLGIRGKV